MMSSMSLLAIPATVATTHEGPTPATQTETDRLVFHVRGGEHAGKTVRLHSRRCSIGSDPSCTLRLVSPEFAPLHCVVFQGPRGAIVRRWSEDTRVNGESFEDRWLEPGDRLSLGSLELELVDRCCTRLGRELTVEPAVPVPAAIPVPTVADLSPHEPEVVASESVEPTVAPPIEPPRLTRRRRYQALAKRFRSVQTRVRKVELELRGRRDELNAQFQQLLDYQAKLARREESLACAELECQREREALRVQTAAQAPIEDWTKQLAEQQATCQRLDQERDRLQQELTASRQQYETLVSQTEALVAERDAWHEQAEIALASAAEQRSQLQAAQQWQEERAELERRLESLETETESQLRRAHSERDDLVAELDDLRHQHTIALEQLERLTTQEEAPERLEGMASAGPVRDETPIVSSLAPAYTEDRETETPESPAADVEDSDATDYETPVDEADETEDEVTFVTPSADAPVDTAAILARFGHQFPPDEPAVDEPVETPKLPENFVERRSPESIAARNKAAEDDRMIEDYMAELMRRVGGAASSNPGIPPAAVAPSVPPSQPLAVAPTESRSALTDAADLDLATAELERRRSASVARARRTEPSINLEAMRDVANATARAHIDQHVTRMGIQEVYWKLFLAGVALMSGCGLLFIHSPTSTLPIWGAASAFVIAVLWSLRAFLHHRVVKRKRLLHAATATLGNAVAARIPAHAHATSDGRTHGHDRLAT